jgi:hypothetical protein
METADGCRARPGAWIAPGHPFMDDFKKISRLVLRNSWRHIRPSRQRPADPRRTQNVALPD